MEQEAVRELSRAGLQAGGDRAALSHIHTQVTPDRSLTRQSIQGCESTTYLESHEE